MKTATTTAAQLEEAGRRLDASYHASEGIRAHHFIRQWAGQTTRRQGTAKGTMRERLPTYSKGRLDTVAEVCMPGGIFIGGRAKRIYVLDPERGVPFLSSSDMLMASFDGVKLISRKQPELEALTLRKGWTLISRSGTIGNMAYAREGMDGLAGSEHIMRVVPDPKKIPPGYLFAYLSSPTGTALVKSGTFGSVIDTIEPDYVGDLPVPRLDAAVEQHIHELIERAAALKAKATSFVSDAQTAFFRIHDLPRLTNREALTKGLWCFPIPRSQYGQFALTAWTYNPVAQRTRAEIQNRRRHALLANLVTEPGIFYGHQFKRIDADPNVGIELLSQSHVFQERPAGRWISKNSVSDYREYMVPDGAILVAAQGTMGDNELFGHCQFSHRNFASHMITQHILRVIPDPQKINPGYLFAFLSSEYGFQLLRSTECGTKLLGFILPLVERIPVPLASEDAQDEIGEMIFQAYDCRADALQLEDQAQVMLTKVLDMTKAGPTNL